jgi:anhydro-N-acetylmuramic acid kinase
MNAMQAIGIMSGSSLDGLDICAAEFSKAKNWSFKILALETIPFPNEMSILLASSRNLSGEDLVRLDVDLGEWIGRNTDHFIQKHHLKPEIIGSHGHTVFHQPERHMTLQIGNGHAIAKTCNLPVVADFRQQNVTHGGQGAPLVPIGDLHLFTDFEVCINLGGITNLSFKSGKTKIIAGDVVPCNQVLNSFAAKLGKEYDFGGEIARSGSIIWDWLQYLNDIPFFKKELPKSMSNEWVAENVLNRVPEFQPKDLLFTYCQHIAQQISLALTNLSKGKTLITGGGAYNTFLVECIKSSCPQLEIVVPEKEIIEGKEALIFAFMAILRLKNQINCLASYTGANKDLSTGVIYLPI